MKAMFRSRWVFSMTFSLRDPDRGNAVNARGYYSEFGRSSLLVSHLLCPFVSKSQKETTGELINSIWVPQYYGCPLSGRLGGSCRQTRSEQRLDSVSE
jgi:hypothetical protein